MSGIGTGGHLAALSRLIVRMSVDCYRVQITCKKMVLGVCWNHFLLRAWFTDFDVTVNDVFRGLNNFNAEVLERGMPGCQVGKTTMPDGMQFSSQEERAFMA